MHFESCIGNGFRTVQCAFRVVHQRFELRTFDRLPVLQLLGDECYAFLIVAAVHGVLVLGLGAEIDADGAGVEGRVRIRIGREVP